jgi:hypothetical protein
MGLAEHRSVERFKNDDHPGWKAQIDEAAGFEVPLEVEWEELAVDDFAERYAEHFPMVFLRPLVAALSAIAVDEMGAAALREGVSKIVIGNTGASFDERGISFADGVLAFDHKPQSNIDEIDVRTKSLVEALESSH